MTTPIAALLAVLGATCYAAAARLQHEAAQRHRAPAPPRAVLRRRRRRLLAGLALLGVGGSLHVTALRLAPVTVVQPLGVTAVVVSVLWGARVRRRLPCRGTVLALAAIVAGTTGFAVLAAHATVATPVTTGAQLWAGLLVLTVVAACAGAARVLPGRARCLTLAAGAGSAYGCVSVLGRAAGEEFTSYGLSGALGGTLAGLALAGSVGFWLAQRAHAAGPPEVTVACLTVVDPLVAVGIGIGLLHEAPALSAATAATALACWALAVAGVLHITRSTPASHLTHGHRPLPRQEHPMPSPSSPRPQRIVIGADTFPPDVNGNANFAHRLAEGLADRGHQVHVVCPATEAGPSTTAVNGIAVHRLVSHRTPAHPTFRVCLPWQTARPAARLLDDIAPDVVHIQSHFAVCRSLAAAAHRRRIPVVATNHFMPENLTGYTRLPAPLAAAACRLAWRDLVRVFRRARFVTAPTPRAVRLLHDNGLTSPALPVSCGLDLARFSQPATDRGDGETRVLFVGRLDEEKNVHELLRALALLPARRKVRGEIVGDGSRRRALENLARDLGIADRVTFHGLVSDREVLAAYARCDVFCMPGTAELQSLVTMEAMAAGLPVVAADAMALPHLVHPGVNGHLFPPGEVPTLAGHLAALAAHPAARRRMGEAGRAIVAEHDIRRTLATFEDLYLHATARPGTPAAIPRPTLPSESEQHESHEYAARSGR
ncbi:glucosyltransferase [Streptomyces spinoverrucosus]|uniref:Glucosyltransferase n=1 Tax=Streptomyces spinoverrucosus TaxID=284043 RepID=A0A4Y3VWR5_9ACTN|nr:glycosyltransferase [Streptomyces spinoverrucosus]GEC10110.1 glucosyltransferase [Streptomyces spinoverrucosus]GHB69137.1 glucosyltransferase [Streptomyces spinoverrucosus]